MPYYKKYASKPKYNVKRTTSSYKKKKFSSKKAFQKPTQQKSVINSTVMPRELYVKLPWMRTQQTNVPANSALTVTYLGNSLLPTPTGASLTINTGDVWSSGVSEYSAFYSRYRVLGSKITIQLSSITTTQLMRLVLVPISGGDETSTPDLAGRITELDALTYDQLAVFPNAQCKTLGLATGGNTTTYFKMFRKTKNMVQCKDLRDNDNTEANMPDSDGKNGSICTNPASAFFYYLRLFNFAGSIIPVDISTKMSFYVQLMGRVNYVQQAVSA